MKKIKRRKEMKNILLVLMAVLLILAFAYTKAEAKGSLADAFVPASISAMDVTEAELKTWSTPIWDWSLDAIIGGDDGITGGAGTNVIGYKDAAFFRLEGVGNVEEGQNFLTDGYVGPFITGDIKRITEGLGVVSWIPSWIPHIGVGVITQVNDHFCTAWKIRGFLRVVNTDMIFDGIEKIFKSSK